MNSKMLLVISIIVALAIVLVEMVGGSGGSLLFTLALGVSIVSGCLALVAAVEVAQGEWLKPIRNHLLGLYPLLLVCSGLFLAMAPHIDIYPWHGHETKWLNYSFFMARNFIILLATYFSARAFFRATISNHPNKSKYAVIYLFMFVLLQSFIAFDWIMPLEYPWVSTLLGGFFFIEALYTALAVSGILLFFLIRQSPDDLALRKTLRDTATMFYGFSLLWGGLFYSQYLVIWYGHIPEESHFLVYRFNEAGFKPLGYTIIALLFVVPFMVLAPRKIKENPFMVMIMGVTVLAGLICERWFIIAPRVEINPLVLLAELLGIGVLVVLFLRAKPCSPATHLPGKISVTE